ALSEIEARVLKINDHIHSIAVAAKEQATGLQEVNTAVNQMDQVTQKNAAMVEETSAATQKLSSEADGLLSVVSQFNIGGERTVGTDVAPQRRENTAASAAAVKPAGPVAASDQKARVTPVRAMTGTLAKAFGIGGGASSAAAAADWEEF